MSLDIETISTKLQVDVCFSPALYPYYATEDSIVVVIDVLRATSTICAAFEYGVEKILPLATEKEALKYKAKGYKTAGEREGETLGGFDFGNSPFSYMDGKVKGIKLAMTTTNGTQAIEMARNAYRVAIGSFLNQDALADWLIEQEKNIILLCAGYKYKFNFEDTIFAGALAQKLIDTGKFATLSDSVFVAMKLYELAKNDMFTFLRQSSHRIRLKRLNLKKDIKYCFYVNKTNIVPVLDKTGHIIDAKKLK